MSAHVLLEFINEVEENRAFYSFFAMSLINSIMQEHEY